MRSILYLFVFIMIFVFSFAAESSCVKRIYGHLRSGPSTSYGKLKTLNRYTPVKIEQVKGAWLYVSGYDFEGWIFSKSIDPKMNCMLSFNINPPECSGKKKVVKRISYLEGFRVLKKELGCNKVVDRRGKTYWISSINAWPKEQSILLELDL